MANITYRQVADYMIPNLTLPPEETAIHLGKRGMLHRLYSKLQHDQHPFRPVSIFVYYYCRFLMHKVGSLMCRLLELVMHQVADKQ